jgi:hypothetical protein
MDVIGVAQKTSEGASVRVFHLALLHYCEYYDHHGKIDNCTGQTPSTLGDNHIVSLFEGFYPISDNASMHEEYSQAFTTDSEFIFASQKVSGYSEILALRKNL